MKKILTAMLCVGAAIPAFAAAPTPVDLAKKAKSPSEARGYIQQALNDPQFNNSAETYYVAGKIEMDAYDDGFKTKMINPDDASAQPGTLGNELQAAYEYFMKALPLDSVPNEKGQVKPKYSKDIVNRLKGHINDYFSVGADLYNAQQYYPQAYNAFMVYGDLPTVVLQGLLPEVAPTQIATAYFNAGLAANQGGNIDASAGAFKKARLAGYEQPEATIYEIACWQQIAQQDESRAKEAQDKIKGAAQFGIEKFGLENPIFINNLVNSMVSDGEIDQTLAQLTDLIAQNPNIPNLYGLRAYVYDQAGKDDLSEQDYRTASAMPNADFETLKNTGNKLYRIGAERLNALEGNSPEVQAARNDIKVNYFQAAKELANRANALEPGDPYIENLLESIDYALTTYFNN